VSRCGRRGVAVASAPRRCALRSHPGGPWAGARQKCCARPRRRHCRCRRCSGRRSAAARQRSPHRRRHADVSRQQYGGDRPRPWRDCHHARRVHSGDRASGESPRSLADRVGVGDGGGALGGRRAVGRAACSGAPRGAARRALGGAGRRNGRAAKGGRRSESRMLGRGRRRQRDGGPHEWQLHRQHLFPASPPAGRLIGPPWFYRIE